MSKQLPDFLIVGAAKCGTTSLSNYLNQHQDIFITNPKEPKFLTFDFLKSSYQGKGDDFTKKKAVKSLEEYLQLFELAKENQVKGEASVDILFYYKKTIPIIKQLIGDPKIIIMLRNPVNRAFSAFCHLVRDNREKLSFEEGLKNENERFEKGCEFIWSYKEGSYYYEAVKAFKENFTNVKVLIFEDYIKDVDQSIESTLSFLGVSENFSFTETYENTSGKPKLQLINTILLRDSFVKDLVKKVLPESTRAKIKAAIHQKNLTPIIIKSEDISLLKHQYDNDIKSLEKLLGIDLSIWDI